VNTNESVDLAAEFLENVGFEIGYTWSRDNKMVTLCKWWD
jgi:hypothetical protein